MRWSENIATLLIVDVENHELSELNSMGVKFRDFVMNDHESHEIWHPTKFLADWVSVSLQCCARLYDGGQ